MRSTTTLRKEAPEKNSTSRLLRELCEVQSFLKVQRLQDQIVSELEGIATHTEIDRIGNVIAKIKPKKEANKTVMFTCHIDHPMLVGMGKNKDKQIFTAAYGGITKAAVDGNVFVDESDNEYKAYYNRECKEKTAAPFWLDDTEDKVDNHAGECFTLKSQPIVEGSKVTSWNAGDRAGIACLLELAKLISCNDSTQVILCFLTRHYYGGRATEMVMERFEPDTCIMVDFETSVGTNSILLFEDEYVVNKWIRKSLQVFAKKSGYSLGVSYNTKEKAPYNKECEHTIKYGFSDAGCVCIGTRKVDDINVCVNTKDVEEMAHILSQFVS